MLVKFEYQKYPRKGETNNSGYSVVVYRTLEKVTDISGEEIKRLVAVGYFLPVTPNIPYELEGQWKIDTQHGLQFCVDTYKESIKPNEEGIVSYLSSGQLKGIGKKMAEKIYAQFGNDTLDILDKEPDKLLEIKGISKKKLEDIKESYIENRGARDVITLLTPHGISAKKCVGFYNKYGAEAVDVIKFHPYRLCEMAGIGFELCERIARAMGVNPNSIERIEAGFIQYLREMTISGHTCVNKKIFLEEANAKVLHTNLTEQQLAWVAGQMVKDNKLLSYGAYVYLPKLYKTEIGLGTVIGSMKNRKSAICTDLDKEIERQQKKMGVTFASEQVNAVKVALTTVMSIITGGPGTGKTLITKAVLDIYQRQFPDNKIVCCAPTGRAARRMTESTGYPAQTIHSLLRINAEDDYDDSEMRYDEIEADLVVVDEVSMLDTFIALALLEAIPTNCKIVFVGDADQLPSVGAGAVLSEIIASGRIPVVKLDTVFRQANTSLVAINAQKMRHSDIHLDYGNDFSFIKSDSINQSAEILVQTYLQEVQKYGLDNVALLCPIRKKTDICVNALNLVLRENLNPASITKAEASHGKKLFRVGDKVMQTKNTDIASNGDMGYITKIVTKEGKTTVSVDFQDGRIAEYDTSELDCLDMGYAITIHKSQGSEYKSVIISLQMIHKKMLNRPLIYTAITRSKKNVIIVGEGEAIVKSIETTEVDKRCTNLAKFINNQVA